MTKEKIKCLIIKQLQIPNTPILDTLLHFLPWCMFEGDPYASQTSILFSDIGIRADISIVDYPNENYLLEVIFDEDDPIGIEANYVIHDGDNNLKCIFAETIRCENGKIVFSIERYRLCVDNYVFVRTANHHLLHVIYDICSESFETIEPLNNILDCWDGLKASHALIQEYSEFRPIKPFHDSLVSELKRTNYPKDKADKLLKIFWMANQASTGGAHMSDIVRALERLNSSN